MGRLYVSADVSPHCGMYAVNTGDDARNNVIALLKLQAHPGELIG
jgi:hypothetical protein